MRSFSFASAVVFLVLTHVPCASAYIPPGSYIVGKMAEKRAALAITDLNIMMQSNSEDNASENEEQLYLKRGGKLRWQRQTDAGETITIVKDGQRSVIGPDGTVHSSKVGFEPLVDLLVPRNQVAEPARSEYVMLVQNLGIQMSSVHLSRFAGRVAFVIGSKTDEKDKPELWVDKDMLVPVRVIYRSDAVGESGMMDVQFRDFGSREGGELVPRVIDRYLDGKQLSHDEVDKVTANSRVSDQLFAPPSGRSGTHGR